MDFSLFYFGNAAPRGAPADPAGTLGRNTYDLVLEGAKFADRNGFTAVWTPERHFSPFGGLYPNPAVTGAAIAAVTERVAIRAGSVVGPLPPGTSPCAPRRARTGGTSSPRRLPRSAASGRAAPWTCPTATA